MKESECRGETAPDPLPADRSSGMKADDLPFVKSTNPGFSKTAWAAVTHSVMSSFLVILQNSSSGGYLSQLDAIRVILSLQLDAT